MYSVHIDIYVNSKCSYSETVAALLLLLFVFADICAEFAFPPAGIRVYVCVCVCKCLSCS